MKEKKEISKFELGMLRDYFQNIIFACENKKVDERPYIKGVAESGINILKGLWNDGKSYI